MEKTYRAILWGQVLAALICLIGAPVGLLDLAAEVRLVELLVLNISVAALYIGKVIEKSAPKREVEIGLSELRRSFREESKY